ncbi:MAG: EAL domain-containing protein [Desulfobacteraceae bacterium]|jgi:diguanylate cyclase (GGDEF)-like protein
MSNITSTPEVLAALGCNWTKEKEDLMDNRNTLRAASDGDESTSVFANRVALLYDSLPMALNAILIGGAILAIGLWTVVDQIKIAIWYAMVLAVTLSRFGLYYAFRCKTHGPVRSSRWLNLFLTGTLCSGITWGSTAYFFFPAHDPSNQFFVAFIVGGMSVGAAITLAASFRAHMLFMVPAMGPLIMRFLLMDASLNLAMGVMVALFLGMTCFAGWRSNKLTKIALTRQYERERAEAIIEFQAVHDSLTGLPNRCLLIDRIDQEISRCRRHNYMAAVLFIDIDRFKSINDSLGHDVGNVLLCKVTERLKRNMRREDTAARIGGDEFALVLSELDKNEALAASRTQRLAEKIANILSLPYEVEGYILHTTSSIGIAMFPNDSADASEILKQSDIAMDRAKQLGRNTIQFYQPEMQVAVKERLLIENELREALQRDEMEIHYQPQLDAEGETVGAEALLRWNHPERGLVKPYEFIAIAEETGMILTLGEWVLCTVCDQLRRWTNSADSGQAYQLPRISINVSPRQFRQKDFFQRIQHVIETKGINPRCIELELTEGMLIENMEEAAFKMEQLSGLGVRLAIDDFGTGYSSLHYLTHLPLHRIKIDRSFIRDMVKDPSRATVVQTIILLAHNLGLDVIGEGVETEAELKFLQEKGCFIYQGYYFSKPLPGEAFFRFLQNQGQINAVWTPKAL